MTCENCKNYIPSKFVRIWHNMIDIDVLVNDVYFVKKLLAKSDKLEGTQSKDVVCKRQRRLSLTVCVLSTDTSSRFCERLPTGQADDPVGMKRVFSCEAPT